MTGLQELDGAAAAAAEWLNELMRRLDWHDRENGWQGLVGALHGLRDSLPTEAAIHLGGQLPPLLRGFYYEGWHPGARPLRSRSDFLDRIHERLHRNPGIDPEAVARAVLALLAERLPPSEFEDARAATPQSLRPLWPT